MKKLLVLFICIAAIAAISFAGTLGSETKTMEGGITQNEMQRSATGALEPFQQEKPLFPFHMTSGTTLKEGTDGFWSNIEGAQDKIVTVTNNGTTLCYCRTVFAFENSGNVLGNGKIYINWNNSDAFELENAGECTIDGEVYKVCVATYKQPLLAGESTVPSLLQVALDVDVTNEDAAAIGSQYKIIAVSQAYWIDPENQDAETLDLETAKLLMGSDYVTLLQNAN